MSLSKNSLSYLLSNIISAAIPFFLLPILTRTLSPAEYGQIAMFQTLVSGLAGFVGINTVGAANRKFYDSDNSPNELSQFNGACCQVLAGSAFILLGACILFHQTLSEILSIPTSWLYSALLFSVLNFVVNLRLGQWQIRSEALKFGALQISNSFFNLGLSLLLILVLDRGAQGRIDAQVFASCLAAIAAGWFLKRDKLVTLGCWRFEYIKQALQFGTPLVPHVFGFFLLSSVDRFVINQELGLNYAGVYMVGVQLSMVLNIVFDAINKAYVPWLFDILKRDCLDEKYKVVKYTYCYFLILLVLSSIPFLVGPWALVFIAGEEYRTAGEVIGFLCLGQIFGGMYLMVTNYIFFSKKTGLLALVTILSGLLNVSLLFILVDEFGIVGASIAFLISKMFQFLMTWLVSYRKIKMPWFGLNDVV